MHQALRIVLGVLCAAMVGLAAEAPSGAVSSGAAAYEAQVQQMDGFVARLKQLENGFAAYYGQRPWSPYVRIPMNILESELPRRHQELMAGAEGGKRQAFETRMAAMRGPELQEALEDLAGQLEGLRAGRLLPYVWQPVVCTGRLQGGRLYSWVRGEDGRQAWRPSFYAGYGAFMVFSLGKDLPRLSGLGANIIQIELGPKDIFPHPGKAGDFSEPEFGGEAARVMKTLADAHAHGLEVNLLISPHYYPAWMYEKYPDTRSGSDGFECTHPKVKEMLHCYIQALFRYLKSSPDRAALTQVTLTNEPSYANCTLANPASRQAFVADLEKQYGSLAGFNQRAQRHFDSFEALLAAGEADSAVRFAFRDYQRRAFAEWHHFLADEVHAAWPGLPVSVKFAMLQLWNLEQGTDPEQFADFSDYNGNDNVFCYTEDPQGRWCDEWIPTALCNDLQYSLKPMCIANTENHVMVDGEYRAVPNDHVYTADFQQFVTGSAVLVTWLWADTDYKYYQSFSDSENPGFSGNIYQRPGNQIAQARALLDANRLAPELVRFTSAPAEVAVLYSPASFLQHPLEYARAVSELWTQLSFCGRRLRFLSERQLARREWGDVRILLAAGASALPEAAAAGLEAYLGQGRTAYADAECFATDEFGNARKGRPAGVGVLAQPVTVKALSDVVSQAVGSLPFTLKVSGAGDTEGIFYRCVPEDDGSWLINLVNYNKAPRQLAFGLPGGSLTNLLREGPQETKFLLPVLKPQLLRWTP